MSGQVDIHAHLETIINALRAKMKERGFTQLAIQKELGWKGAYLSQLFNLTKSLRVSQLLQILAVMGLSPGEFFCETFEPSRHLDLDLETRKRLLQRVRDGYEASCVLYEYWFGDGRES